MPGTTPNEADAIVRMTGICKRYPGVQALDNVSLTLRRGEIRALVGENGAGKSTLVRMLTGAEPLTAGSITVDGRPIERMTPALSDRLGIACVYQNMVLAEHLSVAENIWMGLLPSRLGLLRKRELFRRTDAILEEIGYGGLIDPAERVGRLTASQQGMVAIVRAICRDAKIIVFDEPTAVLADHEVEELFKVIRLLRERHLAVIYISHRLEEIFDLCDTVTVLKDGRNAGEAAVAEIGERELIAMMVGRELSESDYDPTRPIGEELLRAEAVSNDWLTDCSIAVREGEIVGIYGLVGAGRTELSRTLFGRDPMRRGSVSLRGQPVRLRNPRQAIAGGVALIPEDRRRQGLALMLSVKHNINLPVYARSARFGFVDTAREREISDRTISGLAIKTPSPNQRVKNLSGGNQQKVVVGKWLASGSSVFLMDEPTNGVDVGTKEEIYALMNRIAHDGAGIICISSYMPELMDICDRIVVMNRGQIVGRVERANFDEEHLLRLAIRTTE